jgi:hypothetical protein
MREVYLKKGKKEYARTDHFTHHLADPWAIVENLSSASLSRGFDAYDCEDQVRVQGTSTILPSV